MVAKILEYSFLIIIAGGVFLYFGYEAAGYFSFIIGGAFFLINRKMHQKQTKTKELPFHRKYTATTWWWLENNS